MIEDSTEHEDLVEKEIEPSGEIPSVEDIPETVPSVEEKAEAVPKPLFKDKVDWDEYGPQLGVIVYALVNSPKVHSDEGYQIFITHDEMANIHALLPLISND